MRLPLLLLVGMLVVGCSAAPASDAQVARRVESQVWSPYCPGVLLSDCATLQARELRDEIEARARDGEDEADILDWVRSEYGRGSIARPETSGTGLIVWLAPLAFFATGAIVVARVLRRRAPDHSA